MPAEPAVDAAADLGQREAPPLSLAATLVRFVVVGAACAVIDFAVYALLLVTWAWESEARLIVAKAVGWVFGTAAAYALNRRFTFQAAGSASRASRVWLLYAVTFVTQVGINSGMLALLGRESWAYLAAFIVAQGTATAINFVVQRALIFRN